jgi:hypothetical protein
MFDMKFLKFDSIEHFIHTVKTVGEKIWKFHAMFFNKYYKELNNEIKDILMEKNN